MEQLDALVEEVTVNVSRVQHMFEEFQDKFGPPTQLDLEPEQEASVRVFPFLRRYPFFFLSGSGRDTCDYWGPIEPGKLHKEEVDAQTRNKKCVRDEGKVGQDGNKGTCIEG